MPSPCGSKERRLVDAAGALAARDVDAILLQEIWFPGDAEVLARTLGGRYRAVDDRPLISSVNPAIPLVGQLGYPLGLLWPIRQSGLLAFVRLDWSVEDAGFHEFDASSSRLEFWIPDGHAGKGVQWFTIRRGKTGETLALMNTHLEAPYQDRDAAIRRRQLAEIAAVAETEIRADAVFCAGDLNTAPTGETRAVYDEWIGGGPWIDLTAERRAACEMAREAWGCGTRIPSAPGRSRWLDYVLASRRQRLPVTATAIEMLLNRATDDPWSDHHGLVATLTLGGSRSAVRAGAALVLRGPATRRAWLFAAAALGLTARPAEPPVRLE